ncbi:MAG: hypothetical protein ACK5WQ_08930 [Alphaproteobacteria bacterium]|jgi:hypothetical protein
MSDKKSPMQNLKPPTVTPEQEKKYGWLALLVATLQDSYSVERVNRLRKEGFPNIPYYYELDSRDIVIFHDQFPRIYDAVKDMFLQANLEQFRKFKNQPFTQRDQQLQTEARNAMADLTADGNWETFSNHIRKGAGIIAERERNKNPQLKKQNFEQIPESAREAVDAALLDRSIRLEETSEPSSPTVIAARAESIKAAQRAA